MRLQKWLWQLHIATENEIPKFEWWRVQQGTQLILVEEEAEEDAGFGYRHDSNCN